MPQFCFLSATGVSGSHTALTLLSGVAPRRVASEGYSRGGGVSNHLLDSGCDARVDTDGGRHLDGRADGDAGLDRVAVTTTAASVAAAAAEEGGPCAVADDTIGSEALGRLERGGRVDAAGAKRAVNSEVLAVRVERGLGSLGKVAAAAGLHDGDEPAERGRADEAVDVDASSRLERLDLVGGARAERAVRVGAVAARGEQELERLDQVGVGRRRDGGAITNGAGGLVSAMGYKETYKYVALGSRGSDRERGEREEEQR